MHKDSDKFLFRKGENFLLYRDFEQLGQIIYDDALKENNTLTNLDITYNEGLFNKFAYLRNEKNPKNLDVMIYMEIDSNTKEIKTRKEYLTKDICLKTNIIKSRMGSGLFPYLSGNIVKMMEKDKFTKGFSSCLIKNKDELTWIKLKNAIEPHFEFNLTEEEALEFWEIIENIDDEILYKITNIFNLEIEQNKKIASKDRNNIYFALSVDGILLGSLNIYKYIGVYFNMTRGIKTEMGVCGCCSNKTEISPNFFGKLPFKIYTTTEGTFGSGFGNFERSFAICSSCFSKIYLFLGDMFDYTIISKGENNLKMLTYPVFLNKPNNYKDVKDIAKKAKLALMNLENPTLSNLKEWRVTEDEAIDTNSYYYINTIGYKQNNQSTDIKFNISNIQSIRLLELLRKNEIHGRRYRIDYNLNFNFNFIRELRNYITLENIKPEKNEKFKDSLVYSDYLSILNNLLTDRQVNRNKIIDIISNKLVSANLKLKDEELHNLRKYIPINIQRTLLYLEDVNLIPKISEGGKELIFNTLELVREENTECKNIYNFAVENKIYDDERLFLILMGYSASYVDYLQSKKKNKGILNNSNLDNMDMYSIKELVKELVNKHNIYKSYTFDYSQIMKIMLTYLATVEDLNLINSDRVITFFLGVSLRLNSYI